MDDDSELEVVEEKMTSGVDERDANEDQKTRQQKVEVMTRHHVTRVKKRQGE